MSKTTTLYLDRVEGELAVFLLENREFALPMALLPAGAAEGQWYSLRLEADEQATAENRQRVAELMKELSGQ